MAAQIGEDVEFTAAGDPLTVEASDWLVEMLDEDMSQTKKRQLAEWMAVPEHVERFTEVFLIYNKGGRGLRRTDTNPTPTWAAAIERLTESIEKSRTERREHHAETMNYSRLTAKRELFTTWCVAIITTVFVAFYAIQFSVVFFALRH
jgi:ferric-dicitrate binding protein FerR (iron transport regulator)